MSEDNHRQEHRQRVLKGATIITDINTSEIACTIRNMHASGAELRVPIEAMLPDEFLLYIPTDGKGFRAVVRWRKNDRVGVEFLREEPKPHWHYG